jgi:hypothetical protein
MFSGAASSLEEPSLWAAGVLRPDFLHGLQGSQFYGTAVGLVQKNQACWQQEFQGLISHTSFRVCSSAASSVQRTQAWGQQKFWGLISHRLLGAKFSGSATKPIGRVLGPDFPHRLQGMQFSGTASVGTEPAGLHLLLPMEQGEPWVLLT